MDIGYNFDAEKITYELIEWIRGWFAKNGNGCNAVIGISGGKDSSVVAALCVAALGMDKVIGVLMPNGEQSDLNDAAWLCEFLNIRFTVVNVRDAYKGVIDNLGKMNIPDNKDVYVKEPITVSEQTKINLPPRLRMATLFAVSQSYNGRVANTCNLSEDWIGYSTLFGDSAGQFAPLSHLTAGEVVKIGQVLGLPNELIYKVPSDGLTGKTDEDNFGFTYSILDRYIRTGKCEDETVKAKIDKLHYANRFKLEPMPYFSPDLEVNADD